MSTCIFAGDRFAHIAKKVELNFTSTAYIAIEYSRSQEHCDFNYLFWTWWFAGTHALPVESSSWS